jgi:hypothetical protein
MPPGVSAFSGLWLCCRGPLQRDEQAAVWALEAVVALGASFEEWGFEGFLAMRARDLVGGGLG